MVPRPDEQLLGSREAATILGLGRVGCGPFEAHPRTVPESGPLPSTAHDDELLLEQEILGDDRSPGPTEGRWPEVRYETMEGGAGVLLVVACGQAQLTEREE